MTRTPDHILQKIERRRAFLYDSDDPCDPRTIKIHQDILNMYDVGGHLNPNGLGDDRDPSRKPKRPPTSIGFETVEEYRKADKEKLTPYGGPEYGIPGTAESVRLSEHIAGIQGGSGGIVCPSGLAAITTTIDTLGPRSIAIPENVYGPLVRFVEWANTKKNRVPISLHRYPSGAGAAEFEKTLQKARREGNPVDLVYIEAPCSKTFEIPKIDDISELAIKEGALRVWDNSWAGFGFKPLKEGFADVELLALTKYISGFCDAPGGIAIARDQRIVELLQETSRACGSGTVSPDLCDLIQHRSRTAEKRTDMQYETARAVMELFDGLPSVAAILHPARKDFLNNDRFEQYFGKGEKPPGNSLFTVIFREDMPQQKIDSFVDGLHLFRIAESWGGHVSLVLPVDISKSSGHFPKGAAIRVHVGLEHARDLKRDIEQAAQLTLNPRPAPSRGHALRASYHA